MQQAGFVAVLTTIQEPTASVRSLSKALSATGGRLIAIGDRKGPARFEQPATRFYSIDEQVRLPFALAKLLPEKHYTRKNLGYLLAFQQGAPCIYETDDDNAPDARWTLRSQTVQAQRIDFQGWCNVYRLFSSKLIWPRGLPLDKVNPPATWKHDRAMASESFAAPIQQSLADLAPDVDAIWRLLLDQDVNFDAGASVWLPRGAWCPFNSQNTWWWPAAYPLMYLPSFCTFRMTDIWRSLVAQRCLWELGFGLVFHAADVVQDRNLHNLMRDFADEVPGYLQNDGIAQCLDQLKLSPGPEHAPANLVHCYEALVERGFFPAKELDLLKAWVEDVKAIGAVRS